MSSNIPTGTALMMPEVLQPAPPVLPTPAQIQLELFHALGIPDGLVEILMASAEKVHTRYCIVENSGYMAACGSSGGRLSNEHQDRVISCSMWEELQDMLQWYKHVTIASRTCTVFDFISTHSANREALLPLVQRIGPADSSDFHVSFHYQPSDYQRRLASLLAQVILFETPPFLFTI